MEQIPYPSLIQIGQRVIHRDANYNAFPYSALLPDGTMYLAFRQARDPFVLLGKKKHIDPASKAVFMTSSDGGAKWSDPAVLHDDFLEGVMDPCLTLLRDGTLFCTFFTWRVIAPQEAGSPQPQDQTIDGRWVARQGGAFSIRSRDGGQTWDEPRPITNGGSCVHGNAIEMPDGSLILGTYRGAEGVFIVRTEDRGETWQLLSAIPHANYRLVEPNLFFTPSGKLVLFIRSINLKGLEPNGLKSPLFTCESEDGGKTWSPLVKREIFSFSPFHILKLQSGRILVTYGYRFAPFGIRAFFLDEECRGWEGMKQIVLREDGCTSDLGYTTTVQLSNGDLWIFYYYHDTPNGVRYIAATICRETEVLDSAVP